jgi:hypothetical protein
VAARSEVEDGTCGRYIGFNLMRMARHAGLLDLRTFTRRDAAMHAVLSEPLSRNIWPAWVPD